MIRVVTMLMAFLTFVAFASLGGTGGMERVQGQIVHARGAIVLVQSQQDRCQIAAPCSLSCVVCAAGMLTKSTYHSRRFASAVDLRRPLEEGMAPGSLYRPPKA